MFHVTVSTLNALRRGVCHIEIKAIKKKPIQHLSWDLIGGVQFLKTQLSPSCDVTSSLSRPPKWGRHRKQIMPCGLTLESSSSSGRHTHSGIQKWEEPGTMKKWEKGNHHGWKFSAQQ